MLDFVIKNAIFFMPCVFILGYTAGQFFILHDLNKAIQKGKTHEWLEKMGLG